jgi:predicted Rossmann fold nucleotide-binding protein DprA/Smf involved in DNA uptake
VAVLGHGLDAPVYPPQHAALAETITERGALVTPFDAEVAITRKTLLARNHWIARLAHAVWVVQTGVPGGALSAAAHARQLGIPVLTTPWPEEQWEAGYQALQKHGAESVDVLTAAARLETLSSHKRRGNQQGVLLI